MATPYGLLQGIFPDPSDPRNAFDPNSTWMRGLLAQQQQPSGTGLLAQPAAADDSEADVPAPAARPMASTTPVAPPPAASAPSAPMNIQPPAQMMTPAAPAAPKEEPGFWDKFSKATGSIYGGGGPGDTLINLGVGLASNKGNWGKGLMDGMNMNSQQGYMKAQGDLAKAKAMKEQAAQQGAVNLFKAKGYDDATATALAATPAATGLITSAYTPEKPVQIDVTQPDGSTQKKWVMPGKTDGANIGAPAKDEDATPKPVQIDVTQPDGTTRKQWVLPGQATGTNIGAAPPAQGVDQAKLAEERAKLQAKNEADKTQKSDFAANMTPHIERAYTAYSKLKELNAIGPAQASSVSRTFGGMMGSPAEVARQEYEAAAKELELAKAQISMKGQGSVTESERKLLALTLPRLDAADASIGLRTLEGLNNHFRQQRGMGAAARPGMDQQAMPQGPMPEGQPTNTAPARVRRYNPATGRLE